MVRMPVTKAIADRWGRLTMDAKKKGISLTTADGLIAATAIEHDLAIVTRNVTDFARCGAAIINPLRGVIDVITRWPVRSCSSPNDPRCPEKRPNRPKPASTY